MKPLSALLIGVIQLYRWSLSAIVGRGCRYLPSCSAYAQDAIRAHGAWAGCWLALARISRCHPLGGSGWDPAPVQIAAAPWWAPWRLGDWRGGERRPNGCEHAE